MRFTERELSYSISNGSAHVKPNFLLSLFVFTHALAEFSPGVSVGTWLQLCITYIPCDYVWIGWLNGGEVTGRVVLLELQMKSTTSTHSSSFGSHRQIKFPEGKMRICVMDIRGSRWIMLSLFSGPCHTQKALCIIFTRAGATSPCYFHRILNSYDSIQLIMNYQSENAETNRQIDKWPL